MGMERLALRCCFLACLCAAGAYCSATLVQTPRSSLALVDSVTELVCTMKKHLIDMLGVYWYRQPVASEELQYIMFASLLEKNTQYGANISRDRFKPTRDHFRNLYMLKISALKPSDNGTYYCFVKINTDLIFGDGTELRVVETLPLTTTKVPETKPKWKRRDPSKSMKESGKESVKGSVCSLAVWAPLVFCVVVLLIVLAVTIHCLRSIQRRFRNRFRKQLPP
ncbi:T-cell surface glycoprotein CD8 beta chain [Rhinatrema bivittatum]|uniref:T-cell surface glycoprotein CD8 beta chain n=1 Tax=Rhinatrema bivittatum TaxID=194408 RepID=UPI001128F0D2|nr:T-cell surface glycoprotein CD8 beta chain [Rhinatrema bivittatum]